MRPETKDTLQLFVEKANKLARSGFVRHIVESGFGLSLSAVKGQPVEVDRNVPDEEALDALTRTMHEGVGEPCLG